MAVADQHVRTSFLAEAQGLEIPVLSSGYRMLWQCAVRARYSSCAAGIQDLVDNTAHFAALAVGFGKLHLRCGPPHLRRLLEVRSR